MFGTEPIEFAVATVIAVHAERLDLGYLREWAQYLNVNDLLDRVLAERHQPLG